MHFFVGQGAKTGVMPKYNEDFGNAAWQKKALILTIVLNFNSFLVFNKFLDEILARFRQCQPHEIKSGR